jgi:hypothetical protein
MSTEPRLLTAYLEALIADLGHADSAALSRLRQIVGARRARIGLDAEVCELCFAGQRFLVMADGGGAVEGLGSTSLQTVQDLMGGRLEVNEALLSGRLRVQGGVEDIARIFQAIEILIDVSVASPPLQELAAELARRRGAADPAVAPIVISPRHLDERELALLRRLDLLP